MFIFITKYFGFLDFNYFYTQYIEYWANQKKDQAPKEQEEVTDEQWAKLVELGKKEEEIGDEAIVES